MTIRLIRIFFVIISTMCGYYLWPLVPDFTPEKAYMGAVLGFAWSIVVILVESSLKRVSLRNLSVAAFGLMFGIFMSWMVGIVLRILPMGDEFRSVAQMVFTLIFCYLGMVISIKGKDEFNLVIPYVRFSREDRRDQIFILDTSVIIDGRIAGVCESGFMEGKLIVPRFVLQELQQVADSTDDGKRSRGRRGLDILDALKSVNGIEVIIHEERFPEIKEVDAKLVRLAKILNCPIFTNDLNLNKVAKLDGVKVLNLNDLAGAMRPVVFPGEQMTVHIKKEGKEKNQGVAFMDDGTMIVVDNGRRFMGRTAKVAVSSVLQTSAGRMIFANIMEKNEPRKSNGNGRSGGDEDRSEQGPAA
ncbi:MAG: PIN domain-containing protein [Candidatus Omnitrophica bacterium]|nr:PIN domain-containing protein [Candidatus Omnitrophota bacterium]MDD5487649.1 PIN domain-containing protein [Candidatus Omnitrophota bacterium]